MAKAFRAVGWDKPMSQFERYLEEHENGSRHVLVTEVQGEFAGYVTVIWESGYQPFKDEGIPEIQDFNVLPKFRNKGIGSTLLDQAESLVSERSDVVGIGVGLYADYGSAQRLYVKRGYVPDGRGITCEGEPVKPGDEVRVDDALVLHFTKGLT